MDFEKTKRNAYRIEWGNKQIKDAMCIRLLYNFYLNYRLNKWNFKYNSIGYITEGLVCTVEGVGTNDVFLYFF